MGALYHGASVDKLSYDENRQKLREIKEQVYDKDPAFRGAAEVVHWYISSDQTKGLMTRSIVEGALKGKSVDEILADPKVTKYIEQYNSARIPEVHVGRSVVETLVSSAPGYYSTLRGSEHAADTLYRGCKDLRSAQPGKEFELRGPTAVSHSRDIALSYSGGVLLEIEKGAHALPSRALETVRSYAQTGDEYDTLPVFYQRSENAVHPKGVGHGFSIDWDTDRELTTSGRFEVVSTEKKTLSYEDAVTGKTKSRTFTVHKVRQTGVF